MAGYGVVNALFGVANQAITSVKADKQKEPDLQTNKASLNKVANDISKKESEITEKNTKLDELKEKLSLAETSKSALEGELDTIEGNITSLEEKIKNETDTTKKSELQKELTEAKKKKTKIEADIKTQQTIIDNTPREINTCERAIETLKDDVENLEAEQKELQSVVDNQAIKKSKSLGYQRADESCVTKWSDKKTCDNDIADKKEIRSAIYKFKTATKKDEKRAAANAIINMYNSNENEFKTKFGDAYTSLSLIHI